MTDLNETKSGPDIEALKAKHGDIFRIDVDFQDFNGAEVKFFCILKKPARPQFERIQKEIIQKPTKASRNLIADLLLFPSQDDFNELCDKYPGLVASIAGEMMEGFGFTADVVRKKL